LLLTLEKVSIRLSTVMSNYSARHTLPLAASGQVIRVQPRYVFERVWYQLCQNPLFPSLTRMWDKRQRGYRAMGYQIRPTDAEVASSQ